MGGYGGTDEGKKVPHPTSRAFYIASILVDTTERTPN